jgi:hypothetical protein
MIKPEQVEFLSTDVQTDGMTISGMVKIYAEIFIAKDAPIDPWNDIEVLKAIVNKINNALYCEIASDFQRIKCIMLSNPRIIFDLKLIEAIEKFEKHFI